jgi:hypothetical protein
VFRVPTIPDTRFEAYDAIVAVLNSNKDSVWVSAEGGGGGRAGSLARRSSRDSI